jgi:hypothetical protein
MAWISEGVRDIYRFRLDSGPSAYYNIENVGYLLLGCSPCCMLVICLNQNAHYMLVKKKTKKRR